MARIGQDMVNELLNAVTDSEAAAIESWSNAYAIYFEEAESNGIPVETTAIASAKSAMSSAMGGLSVNGANAIQSGITAFWGVLAASPTLFFPGSILITPPSGLSSISSDILLAAPLNVANQNSASDAIGYIVNGGLGGNLGIHNLTLIGATATFPPAVVVPIL